MAQQAVVAQRVDQPVGIGPAGIGLEREDAGIAVDVGRGEQRAGRGAGRSPRGQERAQASGQGGRLDRADGRRLRPRRAGSGSGDSQGGGQEGGEEDARDDPPDEAPDGSAAALVAG